jgi:hypothetical protein
VTTPHPPEGGIWVLLNDWYSHPAAIVLVVLVLTAWTIRVGSRVLRAGRSLRSALDSMRGELVRSGEAHDLSREYDALASRFRADPVVGDAWAAMDQTLHKPRALGGLYRQTVPAGEFFGPHLLGPAGADMRTARAHSNTLVGVGLVLTFLGLVLALKAAGGSLGASEPGLVQDGLGRLLGTAATKFAFSVAALVLSLLWSGWLRGETRHTEASVDAFVTALDRRLPPLTQQEVGAETQTLLRDDAGARREEIERLADAIAERFDDALRRRLGDAMAPLTASVTKVTGAMSEANRLAIQEMADRFQQRLEASVGTHIREATLAMERAGGHVGKLAETLAEVRDGLAGAGADAARDISQATSDAARRMADAAEVARLALTAAGPEWERSSARAATLLRDALLEGTASLRNTLEVAGEAMEEGAGRAGARLEEGGKKIEDRLARAASDAGREIRGAGGVVAAASAALAAAGDETSNRLSRGARELGDAAGLLRDSIEGVHDASGTLATTLQDWRMATGDAASLVARAAASLDAAAGRMADAQSTRDAIQELRAVLGRLETLQAEAARAPVSEPIAEPAPAGTT